MLSTVAVAEIRQQADDLARERRELDIAIQKADSPVMAAPSGQWYCPQETPLFALAARYGPPTSWRVRAGVLVARNREPRGGGVTLACTLGRVRELTIATPDGRSLVVYDAGDSGGRPIVFHHGTPSSGLPFDQHVGLAQEQGVRLVSYDRAGYGESTRRPGRRVADVVQDVEAIAGALGLDRFATWGLSGGGPHALATAAGLPERVVAVAAVASIAPPDRLDLELTEGMGEGNIVEFGLAQQGEEALRPALERDFAGIDAVDVAGYIEAMRPFLSDVDAEALNGELGVYLLDGFRRGLARSVDGWVDDDIAFTQPWGFELEAIRVPTLVVQGRHDLMVPWAHGEWLARNLPSAEGWLRDEEGHLTLFVSVVFELHEWLLARFRG